MTEAPVIFTTLGDAGGIGPELVARSLASANNSANGKSASAATTGVSRLIVGPESLFREGCEVAGVESDIPVYDDVQEAIAAAHPVALLNYNPTDFSGCAKGESSAEAGALDLAIARFSTELFQQGLIDGFVFAPVNKLSLKMGGSSFEGYKAYIADQLGVSNTAAEINTIGDLWTTRVSSHIAIADVPKYVTRENVLEIVQYFDRELRRFGYDHPKIAVSGLNPHNGDGGMFGREEIDHIAPAVEDAQQHQINVSGPYSPDTVFLSARKNDCLGVVSMYHDQCQIATKLLGFDEGVTYFGGLPYPITTPAHGTAYDIAGSAKASVTPFNNALNLMTRAARKAKGLPV